MFAFHSWPQHFWANTFHIFFFGFVVFVLLKKNISFC